MVYALTLYKKHTLRALKNIVNLMLFLMWHILREVNLELFLQKIQFIQFLNFISCFSLTFNEVVESWYSHKALDAILHGFTTNITVFMLYLPVTFHSSSSLQLNC